MRNIVIVDDHTLIADALAAIINNFNKFSVIYQVSNGLLLQQKLEEKKNKPDIILLDISMPIMNGFETMEWLQQHHPDIKVLVLSMQNDDESVLKMIRLGANGYLLKNATPIELEKALNAITEIGYYYQDWAANTIFQNLQLSNKQAPEVKITDREFEFLKHCCTDLSYKEIAVLMFCSPRTVEGYRDALFEKLEIKSRIGLAMYAVKSGLVKL
jgi:DNA-binding NarL/FixJ family response regulator